ncbi:MAG: N-acetylmuramoyl-L-alanine amidase-like domain-containing protein [Myxococcota bacterium]
MILVLPLWVLAGAPLTPALSQGERGSPPSRWMQLAADSRAQEISSHQERSLGERLLLMSEGFLGTPYVHSPLGEGEGQDPDPVERFDAVDCLTLVEQAMAMALARSATEVVPLLDELRYERRRAYEDRNHLMEASWLPNNTRKGYLREVTGHVGGGEVLQLTKVLTPRTWSSKTSAALRLPKERQQVGEFPLNVVPLGKVLERARALPAGTLMVVVRDERPLLPTRISHLGILVKKPRQRPKLRHASRSLGKVVDEDLETFLARHAKYGKWKVVGVSFYEVTRPGAATAAASER